MITMSERKNQLIILRKKYPKLEQIEEASSILTSISFDSSFYKSDAIIRQKFNDLEEILKDLKGEREI